MYIYIYIYSNKPRPLQYGCVSGEGPERHRAPPQPTRARSCPKTLNREPVFGGEREREVLGRVEHGLAVTGEVKGFDGAGEQIGGEGE